MTLRLSKRFIGFTLIAAAALIFVSFTARPNMAIAQTDEPNPATSYDGVPDRVYQDILDTKINQDGFQMILGGGSPCVDGFAGTYPCDNVDLLAFLPASFFGASRGNDSWGWTDSVEGGEYALMGLSTGTAFLDISDPENPVYLGILLGHNGSSSTWRDIKVYADHAFIVSEAGSHGMQVFDLTRLRSVANPPENFTEDAHFSGFGSAHNIVINEDTGYAYGVGASTCSGGLHFVDISNPLSPVDAGCFSSDGYTHDAQCVTYHGLDAEHQGSEICFAYNEDTMTIVDVTNKAAPAQLSRSGYSGVGYAHQGWLTEDHAFALMDDELDEVAFGHNTRTRIWDIADLDNPVLMIVHDSDNTSADHNQYTLNGLSYQANYASGLRIADVSNLAENIVNGDPLNTLAFFDTYPAHDNAGFDSAWSTYPYFDSGTVIISTAQGFFIVRPNLSPTFRLRATEDRYDVCSGDPIVIDVDIIGVASYEGRVRLRANGALSPRRGVVPFQTTYTRDTTGQPAGLALARIRARGRAPADPNSRLLTVPVNIYNGPSGPIGLLAPLDGAPAVPTLATFSWTDTTQSNSFTLEVAMDAAFTQVIYTVDTPEITHTVSEPLPPSTTLYWRVRGSNPCASGPWSEVRSLTTQAKICAAPDLAIMNNVTVTDTFTIPFGATITDLDIDLAATHGYVGDLEFTLTHEDTGTTAVLIDRPGHPDFPNGCFRANVGVKVNDQGPNTAIEDQCYSGPALFGNAPGGDPPANVLSSFNGETLAGTWTLSVTDHRIGDEGTLDLWCLDAETTP